MRVIKRVEFTDVLNVFDQEHPTDDKSTETNTNSWARQNLSNANNKFQGKWVYVRLSRKDVLDIMLPWHASEGGAIELVPETEVGLTVDGAAMKVRLTDNYKSKSPKCWRKIQYFIDKGYSPVFLSVGIPSNADEYRNMPEPEGRFIHLDGLHRLIAWAVGGSFKPVSYLFSRKLTAYIAGL